MRTMTKLSPFRLLIAALLFAGPTLFAQQPMNRDIGVGVMFGEPSGFTAKFWTAYNEAFVTSVGVSRFDNIRLGLDYLWHFNAFRSDVVGLYVGPGVAVGAIHNSSEDRVGARGVLGMNIVPRSTALEIFLEAGPLVTLSPSLKSSMDVAAGLRIYP